MPITNLATQVWSSAFRLHGSVQAKAGLTLYRQVGQSEIPCGAEHRVVPDVLRRGSVVLMPVSWNGDAWRRNRILRCITERVSPRIRSLYLKSTPEPPLQPRLQRRNMGVRLQLDERSVRRVCLAPGPETRTTRARGQVEEAGNYGRFLDQPRSLPGPGLTGSLLSWSHRLVRR